MTAPERIWAFEDEGGGVPRSGIWIDEQSECPDGSPEYVLASTAREAAMQYLSDTGQMMERIADLTAANIALAAECARLKAEPHPTNDGMTEDWYAFLLSAMAEADKAMRKFPQPNYVISKVAEEAGEVVKAAIHFAEGRETAENVRGEMKQLIAMLYRLWVEGDQVHGMPAARAYLAGGDE